MVPTIDVTQKASTLAVCDAPVVDKPVMERATDIPIVPDQLILVPIKLLLVVVRRWSL